MEKGERRFLKLTILSISLMISAASAIAVTLPMIKNQFPEIDPATVESLVTIPSFTMMVFILLSTFIIKRIGKKNTVILGLSLALIGGVIPIFVTNFTIIYLSRFILGAGTGIYNSLAISLIGEYYVEEEQQKMLGYQTAFSTLGSSFVTFLAGILVNISWNYAYIVYFFTLPIIVMVLLFLPQDRQSDRPAHREESSRPSKQRVNGMVIYCCLMMFVFFALIMTIYTKTSTLIVEQNYANQGFLGTGLTIASLLGALTGFVYGKIRHFLKEFTPVVALVFVSLAYFLIPYAKNMIVLTVILVFTFLVVGLFVPYMYDILLPGAPENSANLAVSLAMVACNLGSFFSPYILRGLGMLVGNEQTTASYTIGGIIYLFMAVIFVLFNMNTKRKTVLAD
ncbi:MFS transporter [Enterococcus sp. RIT-PI-f]|uniref:MFS transporter n=1 Tax=Enterococcus sp. RIT-PI-f TaxID=1690244 RepID=UPI0006BA04BB|nr:MFS transporter [Enterococcus sp. RIT-PI-f]KPG71242.1 hypothetical protein AEQ18_06355 [Enterococcus sp. RIT-PI-f]